MATPPILPLVLLCQSAKSGIFAASISETCNFKDFSLCFNSWSISSLLETDPLSKNASKSFSLVSWLILPICASLIAPSIKFFACSVLSRPERENNFFASASVALCTFFQAAFVFGVSIASSSSKACFRSPSFAISAAIRVSSPAKVCVISSIFRCNVSSFVKSAYSCRSSSGITFPFFFGGIASGAAVFPAGFDSFTTPLSAGSVSTSKSAAVLAACRAAFPSFIFFPANFPKAPKPFMPTLKPAAIASCFASSFRISSRLLPSEIPSAATSGASTAVSAACCPSIRVPNFAAAAILGLYFASAYAFCAKSEAVAALMRAPKAPAAFSAVSSAALPTVE